MESFGKQKGKHRQAFDRSLDLFHPALKMRWKRSSGLAQLLCNDTVIWKGHPYTTEKWLQRYQNLPVEDIRARNFDSLDTALRVTRGVSCNTTMLVHILGICDRRVSWNTLSVMLFTERDADLRKLISWRVYGVPPAK